MKAATQHTQAKPNFTNVSDWRSTAQQALAHLYKLDLVNTVQHRRIIHPAEFAFGGNVIKALRFQMAASDGMLNSGDALAVVIWLTSPQVPLREWSQRTAAVLYKERLSSCPELHWYAYEFRRVVIHETWAPLGHIGPDPVASLCNSVSGLRVSADHWGFLLNKEIK